jgi:biotin-(acetyl-CoA carboxylase) ligase
MKKKEGIMPNLKFRKGQNAILLGNGINNVTHSHSWKDLLKHLDHSIRLEDKSYPMAFEEIVLKKTTNSEQEYDFTLKEIKNYISHYCKEINHNKFHSKIPIIDVKTILTTNYDYAI